MTGPRRPLTLAGALLLVAGLGSGGALVALLGRRLAFERERRERADREAREAETQASTARHDLHGVRDRVQTLETERENRARVVEGELAALRRDFAAASKDRDAAAEAYRAAAAERDRDAEDLIVARRTIDLLRADLARASERTAASEAAARDRGKAAEEAARRLEAATARIEALLRPLLQDLRSPDGSLRVRAHEALCAWAGRNLAFRPNGTPEQLDSDARAIEADLLPRR